jgi:hypothetical protein
MLSEAHQTIGLIRFVSRVISGVLKWFRRPHSEDKPLVRRRVSTEIHFKIERRMGPRGKAFRLSLKRARSEEVGPALIGLKERPPEAEVAILP